MILECIWAIFHPGLMLLALRYHPNSGIPLDVNPSFGWIVLQYWMFNPSVLVFHGISMYFSISWFVAQNTNG